MRRLSMFLPPTLALVGLPLDRHVVSRDAGGPLHVASRARVAPRIGIAAGICVAAIRPGVGAGWPALQRQHGGGETEEVRDQESVLIICKLLKS